MAAVLALLIDRAGGVITLSDQDVQRISDLNPELEVMAVDDFSGDAIRIRYRERTTIEGEVI